MTSVETVGAARIAPNSTISSSKAPVLGASLTTTISPTEAAKARATLAAFHGEEFHGGRGHGPIIVHPRPYFPRRGPIIVVPLPIPSIGFHMCYPGEEYTARDVRRDSFGRYWCSNF